MLHGRAVRSLGEHGRAVRVVGAPRVRPDQTLPHELLAGVAEFGRALGVGVGEVQLVQVDVVGAEAVEGGGEGAAGVGGGVVLAGEGAGGLVEDVAPLGGHDHVRTALAEGTAEDPLTVPGAVRVGRVEEGDAEIEGAVHRPYGLLVVHLPPAERLPVGCLPLAADRPAAEAEGADLDAAAPEGPGVRVRVSMRVRVRARLHDHER